MQDSSVKVSEPMRIVRLLLDHNSSALISPFYSHELECESLGEEEEDGERLVKWESSQFRIKEKESDESYARAVREILRKSFFPFLVKTSQSEPWQRELFPWDVYHRGLSYKYIEEFSPKEWLSKSMRRAEYWKDFGQTYKHLLDPFIKSLSLNTGSLVENDLMHLSGVLDLWNGQPHISGYLRHRLLELDQIRVLQSAGLPSILSLSSLNFGVIHDLYQLHLLLSKFPSSSPEEFHDVQRLLLQTLDGGRISGVLKLYLLHNHKVDELERGRVRGWIIEKLLWPLVCLSIERNSQTTKSTILPVTRKTLLYYYDRLFGIKRTSGGNEEEEEERIETRGNLLEFGERDDEEILNYLLSQEIPVRWQRVDRGEPVDERKPLFIIKGKEEEIRMEEEVWQFWSEKFQWETRVHSADLSVEEWQKEFESLSTVELELYHFRLSLFPLSVREIKEERDLSIAYEMLYENIFQTCLILPTSAESTRERLTEGFNVRRERGEMGGLTLKKFQMRLHNCQTLSMKTGTPPSLLILIDAHLFSLREFRQLQQWIEKRQSHVKRLVIMGSIDMLPLLDNGQPFLDLIQCKEASLIKNRVYQYSLFKEETDRLIEGMIERREILFIHQYNNVIDFLTPLLQDSSSVILYHFLSEFDFKSASKNQSDLERLRESLTTGYISRKSLEIRPLLISQLARHSRKLPSGRIELFLIRMEYLEKLQRNEVNHLLLEIPQKLIILTDNISKKWKHPLEHFPNLRYTLPYLKQFQFQASL